MGTATFTVWGLLTWPSVATTTGPEVAPSGTRATRNPSELTTMEPSNSPNFTFGTMQFLRAQAGTSDAEFAPGERGRGRDHFDARSAVDGFLAEDAVGKSHEEYRLRVLDASSRTMLVAQSAARDALRRSAKIPAATSSSTIPVPSGSFSSWRTRRWLDDIERSKKYKTGEKSFPRERDGDEGDELSGDFVDDDELGIFAAGGARYTGGGGDADQGDEQGQDDAAAGVRSAGRQDVGDCGPEQDCGGGSPGAGAGVQAADAEESGGQGCPERGALVCRPRVADGKRRLRGIGFTIRPLVFGMRSRICFLGVGYRRRDHVAAAGPFAQIDEAAAVAAEREVGSVLLTDFLQMGQRSLTVRLRGIRFVL